MHRIRWDVLGHLVTILGRMRIKVKVFFKQREKRCRWKGLEGGRSARRLARSLVGLAEARARACAQVKRGVVDVA